MRRLIVSLLVLGVLIATFVWFYKVTLIPRLQSDSIGRRIDALESRRPSNMTRGQWACAVGWTHNLHGNSQLMFEVDGEAIAAFERRMETKFSGKVDIETIHWVWSEYASICPSGNRYQKHKPLMLEAIANATPNDVPPGMNVP